MVKIDWNQNDGFSVVCIGGFGHPLARIDRCTVGGILNGFINRDESGVFFINIWHMNQQEIIRATEPGFDSLIEALNGHDWSGLTMFLRNYRTREVWTKFDEFRQQQMWQSKTYEELNLGHVGTYTWYARIYDDIYQEGLFNWQIKGEWRDAIEAGFQNPNSVFCIGKALDRGYAKEEAIQRNNTASLWLKGYKRKAVVGMELFYAIAVLGVGVFVNEQRRRIPCSIGVMEGDDLQGLAGDYASFTDVETALVLKRLCGKVLALKDLDKHQSEMIRKKVQDVRFDKNLHSEVASNLDMTILACKLLKLKGLIQGPTLAEALCNAANVSLETVESILNGHKRRYLPHAIWVAKTPFGNNCLMPSFSASVEGMTLSKLPEVDLINMYVGELTGCCQHLDGAGKKVCKEGWKTGNNCNYVFRSESGNIIAHMWVWIDSDGNMVIDSIETRSFAEKESIAKLVKIFALEMGKKGHKVLLCSRKLCIEERVVKSLRLYRTAEVGNTCHGKDWGYSDTDPGDKCYIVE